MRIKELALQGIIAALYVTVSLALSPLSYGAIQFRFAETLKVLPFYNKKYTVGLTIGCLVVNMFSPMGITDVIFGTTATFITCLLASQMKKNKICRAGYCYCDRLYCWSGIICCIGFAFYRFFYWRYHRRICCCIDWNNRSESVEQE